MLPWEHILLGLFPMINLWQTFNPVFGMIFLLSSVLIDVDHYLLVLYATKFKIWDLKKAYNFFLIKHGTHYHIDAIYVFHTIEFVLILLLVYWFTRYIYLLAIIFGWVYHMFFDIAEVIYFKLKHSSSHKFKQMSIVWYLIKKNL